LSGQVNQIPRGKIPFTLPSALPSHSNEISQIGGVDQEALTNFNEWNLPGP